MATNISFTVRYQASCTILATVEVRSVEFCLVIFSPNLEEASFNYGIPLKILQRDAEEFAIQAVSKRTGVAAVNLFVYSSNNQTVSVAARKGTQFNIHDVKL